jgi:predicted MPP superfamily phosphohydrolase
VPLFGSLLVPVQFGRFLDRGLFQFEDSHMFVTSGLGYVLARLGKSGEILCLNLTRSPQPADLPTA